MSPAANHNPKTPARVDILGSHISAITMEQGVRLTEEFIDAGRRGYICVTGVHGVTEALKDHSLQQILNHSFLTTPDGMPLVWIGRMHKYEMSRVYGPDFMIDLCSDGVGLGYRHFLYGGNVGIAEQLRKNLTDRIPGLQIVGTYTPPFRALTTEEEVELAKQVREARPHIIWVGLSTPKQEKFMAEYLSKLEVQVMVGVGAAFDIHTGNIRDAPSWIKRAGLQWAHRVAQEPRRLTKRYLLGNTVFVTRLLWSYLSSWK